MDWYTLSAVIFTLMLVIIFYKDRKNVKREFILFLRKTQRGKGFIIRVGTRFNRFWTWIGTIAVIVGFIASIWIIYLLIVQTQLLLTKQIEMGPGVLIPSFSQKTIIGPGYYAVPFWYWIISIAVLTVVHEGFHGIIAASQKIRIKSLGWGLLAVIPLAFVEPDEKQLKRQKTWKQLRVFAAGSFANFVTSYVFLGILILLTSTMFIPAGVSYQALMKDYPAAEVNLTGIIVRIENYTIRDLNDLNYALTSIGPNKTITVFTRVVNETSVEEKRFVLTTTVSPENKSKGFIGISGVFTYTELKDEFTPFKDIIYFFTGSPFSLGLLAWISLINFFVGLFNLLPIGMLDGGRMWEIVLKRFFPKKYKKLMNVIGTFLLLIIVFDFVLTLT